MSVDVRAHAIRRLRQRVAKVSWDEAALALWRAGSLAPQVGEHRVVGRCAGQGFVAVVRQRVVITAWAV